jgi:FkbM family methyltransferase
MQESGVSRKRRPILQTLSDNRFTRPAKEWAVRSAASMVATRSLLNQFYLLLGDHSRARFQARYARLFRERGRLSAGEWSVRFLGRLIRLPMRPEWSWLDWDGAVSIVGHDIEVKQTYAALIELEKPAAFLDVGANYGSHSILFLSAGVPTISFEPNPHCRHYFEAACALNGINGRWEAVALGHEEGHVDLVYPKASAWLGSVDAGIAANLKASGEVETQRVEMRRLDDYIGDIPSGPVVVKIDVEGLELQVIEGATRLFTERRPKVIFESNDARGRLELFNALDARGHEVHELPWRPSQKPIALQAFIDSKRQNFIALCSGSPPHA